MAGDVPIRFYRVSDAYGFFSNFSRHPVVIDDRVWPTTEHYFQAMKFPRHERVREEIRHARSPAETKRLANSVHVSLIDWDWWEDARIRVMLTALRVKFTQYPDLRRALLDTGARPLIEHTNNDAFWGDGGDGSGANMLGKLLMQVREELRAPSSQRVLEESCR